MPDVTYVTVLSEATHQAGQKHRSSGNFSSEGLGGSLLCSCPDGITFDVKRDKSAATDPTIWEGVSNGITVDNTTNYRSLYIANPSGATDEFQVTFTTST